MSEAAVTEKKKTGLWITIVAIIAVAALAVVAIFVFGGGKHEDKTVAIERYLDAVSKYEAKWLELQIDIEVSETVLASIEAKQVGKHLAFEALKVAISKASQLERFEPKVLTEDDTAETIAAETQHVMTETAKVESVAKVLAKEHDKAEKVIDDFITNGTPDQKAGADSKDPDPDPDQGTSAPKAEDVAGHWCYAPGEAFEGECFTMSADTFTSDDFNEDIAVEIRNDLGEPAGCFGYLVQDPAGVGGFIVHYCPAGVDASSYDPDGSFPELQASRDIFKNEDRIFAGQDFPMAMALRN